MTTEERLNRIEHVTAGLAEERRRDREEFRQLWRDTQRQINENAAAIAALTFKVADTNDTIARLAEESREADARSREADARLGARIDAMVSAIGEITTRLPARE
jgi:methyl-accepting chemotaxis protein